ncbi:SAV_6107 family HEPN domain-containing protein [Streptomyces sp. NPDC058758]|uniref:SAV_6107 family HEPN domain-containing protein n=1 Tax=Streptomyces sp. NPDC058758 TaxID=3346627 RepID=UPI0036841D81
MVALAFPAAYGVLRIIRDIGTGRKSVVDELLSGGQSSESHLSAVYRDALLLRGESEWLAANPYAPFEVLRDRWNLRTYVEQEDVSVKPFGESEEEARARVRKHGYDRRVAGRIPPEDAKRHSAASDLLTKAKEGLGQASSLEDPNGQFAAAHLAALRAAAAVISVRASSGEAANENRRRGVRSAWDLLPEVAPELKEWSELFAASAHLRARAEAGIQGAVTRLQANDMKRDAEHFVRLAERLLSDNYNSVARRVAPDLLEVSENQDTGSAVRHLAQGFDDLFKALGPPPPGIRQKESVSDGGGGTIR